MPAEAPPLLTLVTGIHNVGKGQLKGPFHRPFGTYVQSLERMLSAKSPLTVFTEPARHDWIRRVRGSSPLALRTTGDESLRAHPHFARIQAIRETPAWQSQAKWLPGSPQARLPLYNPLVMSKVPWLAAEAEANPLGSRTLFWVDGGIFKHLPTLRTDRFEEILRGIAEEAGDRFFLLGFNYETNTEIHGFARDAMARYCCTDYVDRVCRGGIFGGTPSAIQRVSKLYDRLLAQTLTDGYMGTEENILTIATYHAPELFHLRMLPSGQIDTLFGPPSLSQRVSKKLSHARHPFRTARRTVEKLQVAVARARFPAMHARFVESVLASRPFTTTPAKDFDVHLLVCRGDVANAIWSLKSFLLFSGLSPRLFLHEDGSITDAQRQALRTHFPHAAMIDRTEADMEMRAVLAPYPASTRYRFAEFHWPALKLLDFAHYSCGRAFIGIDADVLFFRPPHEIIAALAQGRGFFMSDWQEAYIWPPDRWPAVLGVAGLSRVNVGLMGLPASGYDREFVEHILIRYYALAPTPRPFWLEQTVWAASFSHHIGDYVRLPDSYGISTARPVNDTTVAHHFTQDRTASRSNFTLKGLRRLQRNGAFQMLGIPP